MRRPGTRGAGPFRSALPMVALGAFAVLVGVALTAAALGALAVVAFLLAVILAALWRAVRGRSPPRPGPYVGHQRTWPVTDAELEAAVQWWDREYARIDHSRFKFH